MVLCKIRKDKKIKDSRKKELEITKILKLVVNKHRVEKQQRYLKLLKYQVDRN